MEIASLRTTLRVKFGTAKSTLDEARLAEHPPSSAN